MLWHSKGRALNEIGQYHEAIKCYDKALEIKALESGLNYVAVLVSKGMAFQGLEKYEEAIRCYDKALEIDPKAVPALVMKGSAFQDLKRYDEAIRCYDKALEIDPKNIDILNKIKRCDRAIKGDYNVYQ
jgi:tetratricopeptide (TPR) repeat protein